LDLDKQKPIIKKVVDIWPPLFLFQIKLFACLPVEQRMGCNSMRTE